MHLQNNQNPTASAVAIHLTVELGEHVSRLDVIAAAHRTFTPLENGRVMIAGYPERVEYMTAAVARAKA